MEAFLKEVATYLYQNHNQELKDTCLVFPNRRAGVFFSRYLSQMIDKPVWIPPIRTIANLMKEISGYQPGDPLTLVYDLFNVYKGKKKSDETFDEFYYWGEMLLNDFDDIDKYLVDPAQLFQNLADLKVLEEQFTLPEEKIKIIREFWVNVKIHETSPLKENFISLWEILHDIYLNFSKVLQSKGVAYEGMMYRKVLDKIKRDSDAITPYKRFAIIGFNALNECEKEFFKYLKKNDLADFFWDYHPYYIDNTWHEAGYFLRENLIMFPQPSGYKWIESREFNANIEIVSVPSEIGQAKIIPTILDRLHNQQSDLIETAIVLSDEQLLIPVLSSIPETINNVNVTLGYALRFTPVYSFFENMVALQRNLRKNNEGVVRYYHRDVSAMLNHPYVQMICASEANKLLDYIVTYNRIFLTVEELARHDYLRQIFPNCQSSSEFLDYLVKIGSKTAYLLNKPDGESTSANFHGEYWLTFITALNRFKDVLNKDQIPLEIPTLIKVLRKITAGLSIPFKGEPLAGLQVMGVLETRTLDFENIIVLSANEGTLPRSEASSTFIPYNLRKGFGLPTIEHQDAVYAYYFYRLLQRAKNVTLVYNSQAGNRSSEMSRFLFQLKYEPTFHVKEFSMNFRISLSEEKDIIITKTPSVMQELYNFTELAKEPRHLTPTALNAYLECRLKFYFHYVAHIREKEDVTEDIEGSMFGKLLHYAMERIYTPYLRKEMSGSDFDHLIGGSSLTEKAVLEAFATEYFKKEGETPQLHGKSLVVKEILQKYVKRILEFDRSLAPLTLLEFEKTFQYTLGIEVAGQQIPVVLGGKIDRIDQTNGLFRVIDYKTGKVENKFERIEQLFEVSGKKRNKEVLQILLYSYILGHDKDYNHLPIAPGLYGLRDIFKLDFDYHIVEGKNSRVEKFSQFSDAYLEGLVDILKEMYDPSNEFSKTPDKKVCEYCDYKEICHR
jgi:CRISPR/Cas system-associated exonuclease Cas4 (RecB family)